MDADEPTTPPTEPPFEPGGKLADDASAQPLDEELLDSLVPPEEEPKPDDGDDKDAGDEDDGESKTSDEPEDGELIEELLPDRRDD